MTRNSPFFNKRSNSLLRTWLGQRKAKTPKYKSSKSLFSRRVAK